MKDPTFYLTFSVGRLTRLLRDAGFAVSPPSTYGDAQIRFVSHPSTKDISIEFSYTGEEWNSAKSVEEVSPGQYL